MVDLTITVLPFESTMNYPTREEGLLRSEDILLSLGPPFGRTGFEVENE